MVDFWLTLKMTQALRKNVTFGIYSFYNQFISWFCVSYFKSSWVFYSCSVFLFFFCGKPGSRSSFYLIFGRWIGGGFSFCHICSALVTDAIRLWPNRASGTIVDFVVYNTIFNIGWADLQVFLFVFLLSFGIFGQRCNP